VVVTTRTARADDLRSILELWGHAQAEPGRTGDVDSLTKLIMHDPEAVLIAAEEEAIVGSVIAAWDRWRGTFYRLAVPPSHRRQGLGTQLVGAGVKRLLAAGAVRLQAIVVETDAQGAGFWRAGDWFEQVERLRFTLG
jgi:ribosomal protein S18 acetylase RimI-like enzyme